MRLGANCGMGGGRGKGRASGDARQCAKYDDESTLKMFRVQLVRWGYTPKVNPREIIGFHQVHFFIRCFAKFTISNIHAAA